MSILLQVWLVGCVAAAAYLVFAGLLYGGPAVWHEDEDDDGGEWP